MPKHSLIAIVDDDESVREALPDLLGEFGYDTDRFASAEAFLKSKRSCQFECLVLDVAMPGMSGPDLQRELARQGRDIPIVFITAHGDQARCRALRENGAGCLMKPFSDTALLEALRYVIAVEMTDGVGAAIFGRLAMECNVRSRERSSSEIREGLPTVYVVDDDVSVREALEGLIREVGWEPVVFSSASEFLAHSPLGGPSC